MDSPETIQIGIACGYNCEHYVRFQLQNLLKTISGKYRLEFILGINHPSVDIKALVKIFDGHPVQIVEKIIDGQPSSLGHGECLNVIYERMNTKFGMFLDCDIAFLEKDWDTTMVNLMSGNVVIVGPGYDGPKYLEFPNVLACLFITEKLKSVNIDFRPAIQWPWNMAAGLRAVVRRLPCFRDKFQFMNRIQQITVSQDNASVYGRKPGDIIALDVGWELPLKLKGKGYEGVTFPYARCKIQNNELLAPQVGASEGLSVFLHQGRAFISHIGRSSSRDFFTHPRVMQWRDALSHRGVV